MNIGYPRALLHSRCSRALAVLGAALCLSAHAQSPSQVLQGLVNAARQAQGGGPTGPTGSMSPGSQPMPPNREVFWTTKRDFLDAARAGNLMSLPRAEADDRAKVVASVERILVGEYGVPPLTRDCYTAGPFARDVLGLMDGVAALHAMALGTQPPDFVSGADLTVPKREMAERIARLNDTTNRTLCDGESLGRPVPAPYKAPLFSLVKEYEDATYQWYRSEQARRVDRYKGQLARQQQQESTDRAAADRAQATSRAAEQESINAENARIKAEQERRAAINKNRVGG